MNPAQHILVLGLKLYRWVISPAKTFLFGPLGHCRFRPSCSAYALEAVVRHGALAGCVLALKRVCRCHPWGGCGEDPVPPAPEESSACAAIPADSQNCSSQVTDLSGSGAPGLTQAALSSQHRP